ncbi:MAG: two pore domain potassium channel family protein [Microbacteriaceae bacterium]|nr:two pore domain potassium channel family protein [Microbacteriaceae bacterium]
MRDQERSHRGSYFAGPNRLTRRPGVTLPIHLTTDRWRRLTEWPLAVAAVIFLGAYAGAVIGNLQAPNDAVPELIMTVTWVLFGVDYVVSLVLAQNHGRWFITHLPEFLVVVLPVLRPLRLLRLVRLIEVLHRTAGNALRSRVSIYVFSTAALLVLVAGLAILDAEQNAAGANILNFGDAIWWAFVTITTVGYGDFFPVTPLGRVIAGGLMIAGIALIGSVTATIASWFVEQIKGAPVEREPAAEAAPPAHQ